MKTSDMEVAADKEEITITETDKYVIMTLGMSSHFFHKYITLFVLVLP